jgi:hypothetical protein
MKVTINKTVLKEISSVDVHLAQNVGAAGHVLGEPLPVEIVVRRKLASSDAVTKVPLAEMLNLGKPTTMQIDFHGQDEKTLLWSLDCKDVFVRRCEFDITEGSEALEVIFLHSGNVTANCGDADFEFKLTKPLYSDAK